MLFSLFLSIRLFIHTISLSANELKAKFIFENIVENAFDYNSVKIGQICLY